MYELKKKTHGRAFFSLKNVTSLYGEKNTFESNFSNAMHSVIPNVCVLALVFGDAIINYIIILFT